MCKVCIFYERIIKTIENKEKDRWKSLKLWFVNLLIIEYQYVRIYTLKYKGWECLYGYG